LATSILMILANDQPIIAAASASIDQLDPDLVNYDQPIITAAASAAATIDDDLLWRIGSELALFPGSMDRPPRSLSAPCRRQ
jgi:hypothetical protein